MVGRPGPWRDGPLIERIDVSTSVIAGIPAAAKATSREWIGLVVLALPCVLYAMDLTVLNLAVPSMTADLNPTAAQLLWIVDVYGFVAAGALMIMGTLGDRIGRRKLLLIGSAAFGLLSLVAAFSSNAQTLILARALLGLAGATMAPSTLSLISNMFRDEGQRTFAVSVWVASFSLGGAIGPVVGGAIIESFWWGAVFLVPIPIMALLLVVGPRLLPEHRNPDPGRLDLPSAAMTLATVLPIIYGIKRAAEGGDHLEAAAAVALGLVCGMIFVRRQLKLAHPLLDLRLFKHPALAAALAINVLDFFVGFGILVLLAQYLQLILGLTPLQAGLWGLPPGLGFVVGSLLTSAVLKVMRPTHVLGLGLVLGAAGLALMVHAAAAHSVILLTLGNTLFAVGSAPGTAIVANLIVSSAPPEQSGAASALSETASEFGGALGIALLGSLATFIYRLGLAQAEPSAVSPEVRNLAARGIGTATNLARHLVGGDRLLAAAQGAFTHAAEAVFAVSAGIALLTALLAMTTVGKRRDLGRMSAGLETP
jgi:DHA2 family multidrug resistance protein-like MFS transporter